MMPYDTLVIAEFGEFFGDLDGVLREQGEALKRIG